MANETLAYPPLVCTYRTLLLDRSITQPRALPKCFRGDYYYFDCFHNLSFLKLTRLLSRSCRPRRCNGSWRFTGWVHSILWPCLCFHIQTSVKGPSVRVRVATWTARAFPSTKTLHTPEMMTIFSFVSLKYYWLAFDRLLSVNSPDDPLLYRLWLIFPLSSYFSCYRRGSTGWETNMIKVTPKW